MILSKSMRHLGRFISRFMDRATLHGSFVLKTIAGVDGVRAGTALRRRYVKSLHGSDEPVTLAWKSLDEPRCFPAHLREPRVSCAWLY